MDKTDPGLICPNCDGSLKEEFEFCPECGQKILRKKDFSFYHMVIESIGDYFHFDGKFFHSLVPLLFYPGKMTREYLQGKRARYIPPFKLVLFISVVYFIIVGLTINHKPESNIKDVSKADTTADHINKGSKNLNLKFTYNGKALDADSIRKAVAMKGIDSVVNDLEPGSSWILKTLAYQLVNLVVLGQEEFYKKLIHNASKVIFVLFPFVALLLKLLYIRRKHQYYDHLIFSMHFHAFMFFLLLIFQLITSWIVTIRAEIILIISLLYLTLALKRVYGQKWITTVIKMTGLVLLYLVVALPFFFILLFVVSILL